MMEQAFQVITHSLSRLWPVHLFARNAKDDGFVELRNLDEAADAILFNQGLYVFELDDQTSPFSINKLRFIKIKNLVSLQGPIPYKSSNQLSIRDILSLSEAAKLWGLNDSSTLRKAMERDKFYESEVRKADTVWLITYPAMQRVFEARTASQIEEEAFPTIQIKDSSFEEGAFTIESSANVSPMRQSPRKKLKLNEATDPNLYISRRSREDS